MVAREKGGVQLQSTLPPPKVTSCRSSTILHHTKKKTEVASDAVGNERIKGMRSLMVSSEPEDNSAVNKEEEESNLPSDENDRSNTAEDVLPLSSSEKQTSIRKKKTNFASDSRKSVVGSPQSEYNSVVNKEVEESKLPLDEPKTHAVTNDENPKVKTELQNTTISGRPVRERRPNR
ncbi:unnamed protein product [Arabidopsis thaliana]|uniref:Uncharacterized protein n=1 Tax=Arabidopsis thaliana TaxID=3702 RepID=A0A654G436_ARATH|nr:unnamed protein product [Arabidopsis thaliana]